MGDSFAIHSELFTIILTVSGILLLFKQLYFEYWSRRDFSVCILFKCMFVCSWEQISVHTCKWTLVQVNLMGRFYILFLIYFTPNLGFFEWIIQHPLSNKGSNPTMRNRTQTSTFFAPKSRYFLAHVHLYPIDFVLHLRLCKQDMKGESHETPEQCNHSDPGSSSLSTDGDQNQHFHFCWHISIRISKANTTAVIWLGQMGNGVYIGPWLHPGSPFTILWIFFSAILQILSLLWEFQEKSMKILLSEKSI